MDKKGITVRVNKVDVPEEGWHISQDGCAISIDSKYFIGPPNYFNRHVVVVEEHFEHNGKHKTIHNWRRYAKGLETLLSRDRAKINKVAKWIMQTYGPIEGDNLCKELLTYHGDEDGTSQA